MPTYLSPGVFVEEVPAGVVSIEGVGTSTAAFVGLAEKGDLDTAKLITNFTQFTNEFGNFIPGAYLAYAVFSFFAEGGTRCYVTRVIGTGAAKASVDIQTGALGLEALSEGLWGNRLSYIIENPTNGDANSYKLTIRYTELEEEEYLNAAGFVDEVYDNLKENTAMATINGNSSFVYVTAESGTRPTNAAIAPLAGGLDGAPDDADFIGTEANKQGLHSFDAIDEINIVAIPDVPVQTDRADIQSAFSYCEGRGDCFFLADPPLGLDASEVKNFREAGTGYTGAAFNTNYGALYYPWVYINDPLTGQAKAIPPSGAIAGTYANTDETRGVHKAPAGTADGHLNSVVGVEAQITKGEQDILNPLGINVIRSFPQAGIVVWGARTLSAAAEWRYVNVRRLMLFIEESLDEGTQFVVFEPNDPALWGRVRRTINAFLTRVWRDGALFGTTAEDAFFIKVDEENNPPEVRDAGQLIIDVGVAPVKPAEFVVIRISQTSQAGA